MPKPRNYCAAYGCDSQKMHENVSFFSLPKDEQRRKIWLEKIDRLDLLTAHTKASCHFVCSLHFDKSMIRYIPQLKADATPQHQPTTSGNNDVSTQTDLVDVAVEDTTSAETSDMLTQAKLEKTDGQSNASDYISENDPNEAEEQFVEEKYNPHGPLQTSFTIPDPQYTSPLEVSQAVTRIDRIAERLTRNFPSEDEFDSFGKYMASALRALPPEAAIMAKTELQKTLCHVQLRAIRHGQRLRGGRVSPPGDQIVA